MTEQRVDSKAQAKRAEEGGILETIKVIVQALLIALVVRTLLFQPFNIPSGSMIPTLLIGDYLFVSKYAYGYSKFSIPFAPPLFSGRILASPPKRGDIVVFKLPSDGETDYIKRVIGLPGDKIQMIEGRLYINGQIVSIASSPSSYLSINRLWKNGDRIDLSLPMTLRTESLPYSKDKIVALMYGPLVLAGVVPAVIGEPDPAKDRFSDHLKARGKTDQTPPVLVGATTADLLAHLHPDPNAFGCFHSDGVVKPSDLAFMPLYRIYEEHYAVYFPFFTTAEWDAQEAGLRAEQERRAKLDAATLDTVQPGFQQSEVEHKLAFSRSEAGDWKDRKWRDALPGGWFSYEMAVDPVKPMALVSTYFSNDHGRVFELQIDGRTLAIAKPNLNKRDVFYETAYSIPIEMTQGKKTVTVRLVATQGRVGTFGFRTVQASAISPDQWATGTQPSSAAATRP